MPLYDFRCEDGHVTEHRCPMAIREIACSLCERVAHRQFTITEPSRIRITEGFRTVVASDVCEEFKRTVYPVAPQPEKPRWVGGFGHPKGWVGGEGG